MQSIDEARLETDSQYRYEYLAGFMGFGPEDAALIQASAPFLGPLIPQLVETTYEKLLSYDATARHFVPRQAGYEGPLPEGVANLKLSHPQVRFRKEHLSRYFMQLLGRSYDAKMVQYLDMVGKMHTPKAGSKEIDVPAGRHPDRGDLAATTGYRDDVTHASSIPQTAVDSERFRHSALLQRQRECSLIRSRFQNR
jgi:hypothetical protein